MMGENVVLYWVRGILKQHFLQSFTDILEKELSLLNLKSSCFRGWGTWVLGMEFQDDEVMRVENKLFCIRYQ